MLLPLRFGTPMPAGSNSASSSIMAALARRQDGQRDDEDYVWFWYTTTGIIIKYVLFFSFLLIIVGWVVGGRFHAKRRLRKGLKPLSYHAWLLSRQERAQVDPTYAYPQPVYRPVYGNDHTGGADYYGMHSMPPPRDRQQQQQQQQGPAAQASDFAPPAGPPPGR
ncbi:hypothetical protein CIB48_g9960 [Xylaria polymorpha]|nr:hypothetical protein CIB48_g9960 [Xylaria polymorpha]